MKLDYKKCPDCGYHSLTKIRSITPIERCVLCGLERYMEKNPELEEEKICSICGQVHGELEK